MLFDHDQIIYYMIRVNYIQQPVPLTRLKRQIASLKSSSSQTKVFFTECPMYKHFALQKNNSTPLNLIATATYIRYTHCTLQLFSKRTEGTTWWRPRIAINIYFMLCNIIHDSLTMWLSNFAKRYILPSNRFLKVKNMRN